jgi:glycosyltransferase involved in cell wall biosynthesis
MFTVIVPTYNRYNLLKECLDSLVHQTFKNFEVLVCDDGSTDETADVVMTFTERLDIRYLRQANSGGPASPRNLGIKNSKYEWLCFLDSDDLWLPRKLESLYSCIVRKGYKVFCHPCLLIDSFGIATKEIGAYRRSCGYSDFETLLYNGGGVVNSSLCLHKSLIADFQLYNTDKAFHGIEDFIFILNITYHGHKICTIKEPLGKYRIHDGNISANVESQIAKWNFFFTNLPYKFVSKKKLNAFLTYMIYRYSSAISHSEKMKVFAKISFFSSATFRLRIKALVQLVYCFVKLAKG